jgi:DNA-binding MarR family transcriptional regulator
LGATAANFACDTIGDPTSKKYKETIRLYYLDFVILSHITREGYAYSTTIADRYHRTQRTINKHLAKLEELSLIARHGRTRCPYQWYSINTTAKDEIRDLIFHIHNTFTEKTPKENSYIIFDVLLDHVLNGRLTLWAKKSLVAFTISPPRQYNTQERPYNHSIPFIPFCKRLLFCPFPKCILHCNPRDPAEAAILESCMFYDKPKWKT